MLSCQKSLQATRTQFVVESNQRSCLELKQVLPHQYLYCSHLVLSKLDTVDLLNADSASSLALLVRQSSLTFEFVRNAKGKVKVYRGL
jgi:hypothetical protein